MLMFSVWEFSGGSRSLHGKPNHALNLHSKRYTPFHGVQDGFGNTALHVAACEGQLGSVRALFRGSC